MFLVSCALPESFIRRYLLKHRLNSNAVGVHAFNLVLHYHQLKSPVPVCYISVGVFNLDGRCGVCTIDMQWMSMSIQDGSQR